VSEYFVERKKLSSDSDHGFIVVLTGKLHSICDQLICYYVTIMFRCDVCSNQECLIRMCN